MGLTWQFPASTTAWRILLLPFARRHPYLQVATISCGHQLSFIPFDSFPFLLSAAFRAFKRPLVSLKRISSRSQLLDQSAATSTALPSSISLPSMSGYGYGMNPGQAAEAPKRPYLYVGNLSPRVNDYILTEIFAVAGAVVSAKIIQDRNFQHGGLNYGFVEYTDMRSAEQALTTLNGRKIFDAEVRVNWAYQGQQSKEDTQHHYHVFVGDLSPEVNDDVLQKAFSAFGSCSEARVMWDMNTGKSRGYGFLAFRLAPPSRHWSQADVAGTRTMPSRPSTR